MLNSVKNFNSLWSSPKLWLSLGLILAAALRITPHPPNVSAFMAMALLAIPRLPKWGLILAFLSLGLSDFFIGYYFVLPWVYLSYAIIFGAMYLLRHQIQSFGQRLGLVFLASVFFFLATNLAEWWESPFYPKTGAGLQLCFTLALPFFRNALLSDLGFYAALTGVLHLCGLHRARVAPRVIDLR